MGGGAAMRAAAKAAGMSVVNAGFRGTQAELPAALAARKATRQVSMIIPSSEEVKSGVLTASQNNLIDAGVQRPCWELGEWELAGGEEESIVRSGEPMPRLVFGGIPTLEETREATSELKDALEKVYLSSPRSAGFKDSDESGVLLLSNPEYPDTKACVTIETAAKSAPNDAIKAFKFLHESAAAQTVVASIACDPNVWDAVMQNDALIGFLKLQKESTASFSDMDPSAEHSDQSPKSVDDSSDSGKFGDFGNGFVVYLRSLKTTVVDMVSSLSGYFQNLFGGPTAEKVPTEAEESAAKGAIISSFMGLAIMVVLVVLLKRG